MAPLLYSFFFFWSKLLYSFYLSSWTCKQCNTDSKAQLKVCCERSVPVLRFFLFFFFLVVANGVSSTMAFSCKSMLQMNIFFSILPAELSKLF